jgi:hypothetical protein
MHPRVRVHRGLSHVMGPQVSPPRGVSPLDWILYPEGEIPADVLPIEPQRIEVLGSYEEEDDTRTMPGVS